jgi:hypothetical protein
MNIDQLKELWEGLPEEIREEIRREILGTQILERADRVRAARI